MSEIKKNETIPLPLSMPQSDPAKPQEKVNCLQDMLLELIDKRDVTLAQIQRATEIPWSTLMGWHDGTSGAQLADKNLLRLAQFFKVPLEYLVYGIGSDEDQYERFNGGASA